MNTLVFLLTMIWLGGVIAYSAYSMMMVIAASAGGAKFYTTTLGNIIGFLKIMFWPLHLVWVTFKALFKDV